LLATCYYYGQGVEKNYAEAAKWSRKAAEQNLPDAQYALGICYENGHGTRKDEAEAFKWYRKAAEQDYADAQQKVADCYYLGKGTPKNYKEAVKWLRKAAEQNLQVAQFDLGVRYLKGEGVPKDYIESYKWLLLAAAQGDEKSTKLIPVIESLMTREQVAEGQKMAREFKPQQRHSAIGQRRHASGAVVTQDLLIASGTGFFITEDGYLITNEHVAGNAAQARLMTTSGLIAAKVVKVDAANDLALLKADGKFKALPVAASRGILPTR
jgi:hypothetical protein